MSNLVDEDERVDISRQWISVCCGYQYAVDISRQWISVGSGIVNIRNKLTCKHLFNISKSGWGEGGGG